MTSLHVLKNNAGGASNILILCWRGHFNAAADLTLIKALQTKSLIPQWWKNSYFKEVLPACEDTVFLWCLLDVHRTSKLHIQDVLPSQTNLLWIKIKKIHLVLGKRRNILRKGNSDSAFSTLEINPEKLSILKGWKRQCGFIAGYTITIWCRV